MKLEIELVPTTSHFNNLRSEVTATAWKKLRTKYLTPLNNCCEICGGSSPKRGLDLHEVWSYTIVDSDNNQDGLAERRGIQKLERLEGLCMYCHEVKHYYLSHLRGFGDRARSRLQKINGLTDKELYEYELLVHKDFVERSSVEWKIDLNGFKL